MAWGFALVKRSLCSRECLFRKMCLHFNLTFAYFGYSSKKHVQLFSFKASYKFAVWHDIIYPNAESDLQKNGQHNQLAHVVEPVTFRSAALFSPLQATAAPPSPRDWQPLLKWFFLGTHVESLLCSAERATFWSVRLSSQIKSIMERVLIKASSCETTTIQIRFGQQKL